MDNYYDTAQRMYKSSEILHKNQDYHNACYLGGYVVECYAKIIVGLYKNINHQEIAKLFSHNLTKLNTEINYIITNSVYSKYACDLEINFPSIKNNGKLWNPYIRYENKIDEWTPSHSNNFQIEIEQVMQILVKIKNDGHILI